MSKRARSLVMLAVSLSVVWLVFILYGSPWMGLMWVVSLALAAALWASRGARPVPAVATHVAGGPSAPKV